MLSEKQRLNALNVFVIARYKIDASTIKKCLLGFSRVWQCTYNYAGNESSENREVWPYSALSTGTHLGKQPVTGETDKQFQYFSSEAISSTPTSQNASSAISVEYQRGASLLTDL